MSATTAERWEGAPASSLRRAWGVPGVHLYTEVGSTNDVARWLATEGAASGTLVLAETQTAGRGRAGRRWESPPGLAIAMSLVGRTPADADLGTLPLIAGVEVARRLDGFLAPGSLSIKWPNDLLVNDRKIGGILCEAVWDGGRPVAVVVGIGLNVLHQVEDFPVELRSHATSFRLQSGRAPERRSLLDALVPSLAARLERRLALTPAEMDDLSVRDALKGREIRVTEPGTDAVRCSGTALGIGPDGALLVRDGAGVLRSVRSGSVRLAAEGSVV